MKTKLLLFCILTIGLFGCRGSSGKKAIEYGEKVIKAWKKVPQPARSQVNRAVLEQLNRCSTCDGYGVLCLVDQYGNPIYDYNGNLQLTSCDDCGGTGKRVSY